MEPRLSRRCLLLSAFGGLALAPLSATAQPLPYRLRPEDAEIGFTFNVGGVSVKGTAPLSSAAIFVNTSALARSTADVSRARTGIILATEALKRPDVLNTGMHPTARFRSTRIALGEAGRISEGAEITGDLTLRGVTRAVQLSATLSRPAGTAPDDLRRLTIRLTGSVDRRAFGATGYPNLVANAVQLDIRAGLSAV